MPLGGVGKINNSNTSILIILITYSPSYNINSSILSLTIPNDVYLFAPAVSIIYIYTALNASCFAT